jgi:hypothetical protein
MKIKERTMKKVILAGILTLVTGMANAQSSGYGYGYQQGFGSSSGNVWIPLLVGGTVGYLVSEARRQPVYVQQPVIIQQQPVLIQQRVPAYSVPYTTVPPGYRYESILDANCGCYRAVLVPN